VNIRAGVEARGFVAEAWMKNAFDTRYIPVAFAYGGLAPSGFLGENGRPRTFGVSVGSRSNPGAHFTGARSLRLTQADRLRPDFALRASSRSRRSASRGGGQGYGESAGAFREGGSLRLHPGASPTEVSAGSRDTAPAPSP